MTTGTPKKATLSKDVLDAVNKKLKTFDTNTVKKGDVHKLNPSTAAWSVNYTT